MSPHTKEQVLKFLKENFIIHLATATKDGVPASSIMLYYIDDEFNFYIVTKDKSYKSKNMKDNPLVSLSVWRHKDMLVQASGNVEVVSNKKEQDNALDNLADSAAIDPNFWPPIFRIKNGDYIIYKIKPTWLRSLDLQRETIQQNTSPFTEIDLNKKI